MVSLVLGLNGWDITRLWLWLLGSALALLAGMQLLIGWFLMSVLGELSARDERVSQDMGVGPGGAGRPLAAKGSDPYVEESER